MSKACVGCGMQMSEFEPQPCALCRDEPEPNNEPIEIGPIWATMVCDSCAAVWKSKVREGRSVFDLQGGSLCPWEDCEGQLRPPLYRTEREEEDGEAGSAGKEEGSRPR